MQDPLDIFFHPQGVAVIGASSNPDKLSHAILRNLAERGYEGPIYPVNPKGGEILDMPVYRSIADLPDPVELAVIVLSADQTVEALEACGRRSIPAAILVASGFGELGAGGEEREAELLAVAQQYDMRFIGPNCIGVIDTFAPIDTTFSAAIPPQGKIGFISHSGAVCGSIMNWANSAGVGFSRIISLGNQVDVDMTDGLQSLAADPHTEVIAAYIEGLPDGRRFVEAAMRTTPHKPLVILKAGRTPSGTRAVASHTGALAGAERAFLAACRRAGAIPVEDLETLMDAATVLAYRRAPEGRGMVILTNAGGPAAVGADAVDRQGLHLVDLSSATRDRLREASPPGAMVGNPVDLLGGPQLEHYTATLEILLQAPEVEGIMVIYIPQAVLPPEGVARTIGEAAGEAEKPVVCCISGGEGMYGIARTLHSHGVPHYAYPARAAAGLGTLWRYRSIHGRPVPEPRRPAGIDREEAQAVLESALAAAPASEGPIVLDAQVGARLAAAYGLRVPPSGLAESAGQAVALAERAGYPVALKRVAPGVVHKSDVGGVALGLRDGDALRAAFERVVGPGEQGFVQGMAPGGLEVIVGAQRDAQFGPLLMFGLGGTYVEVLQDVAFRLAPPTEAEAHDMLAETAAGKLLAGVRGQPTRDVEGVLESLRRVGWMMADLPEVMEVDLNPLIVGPQGEGAWAVDVRIVVQGAE